MYVLGLDLEGMNEDIRNGVNLKVDRVTEVGAVLWDWELKAPVQILSFLVNMPDRLRITDENTKITGITEDMLNRWGLTGESLVSKCDELAAMMESADFIMAHNCGSWLNPRSGYDFQMLRAFFAQNMRTMPHTAWINTLYDLEFPDEVLTTTKNRRDMLSLEYAHGFINPFPHRAVTDVLALLKIASNYNLTGMIERCQSRLVDAVWSSNYPPRWAPPEEVEEFHRLKNLASSSGFRWNPDAKIWSKTVKECDIQNLPAELVTYTTPYGQDPEKEDYTSDDLPF